MYLPKSQYVIKSVKDLGIDVNLIDELGNILNNGNEEVVVTSFGTYYDKKGIDFDKGDFTKARKIFPIPPDLDGDEFPDAGNTDLRESEQPTVSLKLPPTSQDRKKGVMQRCFYKNKCTGKLKEISKVQLLNLARTPDKCVQLATMNWLIKGPAKDQTIKGYVLEGVESRNKRSLEELKKIMPGVEAIVKSPLEYVEDTFIPTGKEIKPQDKDIVIPSPGKRL